METYTDLPDLKMTFLAILFQTKWSSQTANKTNDFVVKEALAAFASSLEDDDVGYFCDPQSPNQLCNAGELVAKIANSNLPYGFNFGKAVENLALVLDAMDKEDFNKVAIVISDCLTETDAKNLMKVVSNIADAKIVVFGIGKGCFNGMNIIHLEDASDLSSHLQGIIQIWR